MRALLVFVAFAFTAGVVSAQTDSPSGMPSPTSPESARSTAAPAGRGSGADVEDLRRERVDAMLRSQRVEADWFSASFRAQVSATEVDAIVGRLERSLGSFRQVSGSAGDYTAHFANGTDEIIIHLDADDRIDGLFFRPPMLASSSLPDALAALGAARGTSSYVVVRNGTEQAALRPSDSLAVGSTFKLAVLASLDDEIERGQRHWSDVVPLDRSWKSLPTGVLQTWPDDTPLTLATYATEMISISDNTAADALIHVLGQPALRPFADGNDPFLTTRQTFVLKSTVGSTERARYLAARTPSARSSILERVDALPLPTVASLADTPILDVEWHYSVRQLCALMLRVSGLPQLSVNPGVADPASFEHVAYKGGSDVGIINLTTMVTTERGTSICFSATLNDATTHIDEDAFEASYAEALRALASR